MLREQQTMHSIIETHQLTKTYNSLKAVDSLDISVESGEIFGLLGPNSAGKTTTISYALHDSKANFWVGNSWWLCYCS